MSYNFFALMGRMRYIDRWGLMRNTQVENIQEHSHMVAVLAHALAVIDREKFGGRVDPGKAAVAGLYHDASEILTGDLPTPVKYDNPAIKSAYKAVESVAADKLLSLLPEEMRGEFAPYVREELEPELLAVVKAADKLSAHIKCLEEVKAGNAEFRLAAEQTRKALEQMDLPALSYFMEHFLPGFELTLDELQ
ncbi:5'-deoxynucleotidase [Vermiculatibacterium agrestimuris]|uniref:5'-deoxynucleotidase n=1 Tax=Vermiculatibacterium agrestimuris TaxID=2941519 RepID=UPI00203A44DB|nr:5'-deoxynucleotidase [Vermiculatibacterium agrestimuris]